MFNSGIKFDFSPTKVKVAIMGSPEPVEHVVRGVSYQGAGNLSPSITPASRDKWSAIPQSAKPEVKSTKPDPRTAICTVGRRKPTSWWDWLPNCPLAAKKKKPSCWQNKIRRRSRSAASFPFNWPPFSWVMPRSGGRRPGSASPNCYRRCGLPKANPARNPCPERSLPPKAYGRW